MNSLETVLGELGISQYLDSFIDQGFDTWDTILDITESDLDALGVKLGHRRKLQRRIANYRGVAPDVSLALTARPSIEDARHDANRADFGRPNGKVAPTVIKRKYRRHPKPDENAPERPPSAYVLFSNKMREDLKGQNLTFTEIAKLVGENWQNLDPTEKDPYEQQANDTKEKYNQKLSEYKKTDDYRKYSEYLSEFRKRQAAQTQEKDAAKRLRTDVESTRSSSTSRTSVGPSGTSGTGSGSDSYNGSEPPPSRQHRFGSMVSLSTGTSHVDDYLTSPRLPAPEESRIRREQGLSSHCSRDASALHQRIAWAAGQSLPGDMSSNGIPWVDLKTVPASITQLPDAELAAIPIGRQNSYSSGSLKGSGSSGYGSGSGSSGSVSVSQSPCLKTEQSSYGSSSSSISSPSHRTPNDASLPIHALLSRSDSPVPPFIPPRPSMLNVQKPIPLRHPQTGRIQAGFHETLQVDNGIADVVSDSQFCHLSPIPVKPHEAVVTSAPEQPSTAANKASSGGNVLDGISALLKAREIVDRRL
ncbi:hypothetical protein GGS21DRAFT_489725 [Xylaria nigripes]|nr:hypothetical protein GGS21DRAFT_489725 [Xylaria nigripes]